MKLTIEDSGIKLYENCINVVYDSKGHIYEIPNYCINEPYKFDLEMEKKKTEEKEKEKDKEIHLKVFIFFFFIIFFKVNVRRQGVAKTIEVMNFENISEMRKKILNAFSIEKVRMFYYGKELTDGKKVIDYNIKSNIFIEAL